MSNTPQANNSFSLTIDVSDDIQPRLPELSGFSFADIKNHVLSPDYELSLVIIDDETALKLTKQYKDKTYRAEVLAFELDDDAGEVFINIEAVEREHEDYERSVDNFILFLFIHALHHLKGYEHGSTMEEAEAVVRREFGI